MSGKNARQGSTNVRKGKRTDDLSGSLDGVSLLDKSVGSEDRDSAERGKKKEGQIYCRSAGPKRRPRRKGAGEKRNVHVVGLQVQAHTSDSGRELNHLLWRTERGVKGSRKVSLRKAEGGQTASEGDESDEPAKRTRRQRSAKSSDVGEGGQSRRTLDVPETVDSGNTVTNGC